MVTTITYSKHEERVNQIRAYIDANGGCSKTDVKNNHMDMAPNTADKIVNELIDNGEVICVIDERNPRIHHLYINDAFTSQTRAKKFIKSKLKERFVLNQEQIEKLPLTTGELSDSKWVSLPDYRNLNPAITSHLPTFMEILNLNLQSSGSTRTPKRESKSK